LTLLTAGGALAQDTNAPALNTALVPVLRTNPANWVARHEGFVQETQKGGIEVLFLGDSITDFWRNTGSNVWNRYYAPRHAANFGISGDRTQHVLWRMDHGELDGIKPRVVVLLIGTNNTGKEKNSDKIRNTVPETIAGVQAVVRELHAKLPDSKILLLAIFPRGSGPNDSNRRKVEECNKIIAKLHDGQHVFFMSINDKFLTPEGKLIGFRPSDNLHPVTEGFDIWLSSVAPTLKGWVR